MLLVINAIVKKMNGCLLFPPFVMFVYTPSYRSCGTISKLLVKSFISLYSNDATEPLRKEGTDLTVSFNVMVEDILQFIKYSLMSNTNISATKSLKSEKLELAQRVVEYYKRSFMTTQTKSNTFTSIASKFRRSYIKF